MINNNTFRCFILLVLCLGFMGKGFSQSNTVTNELEESFKFPPNGSKPRTWMHAMSGNMSKEGMTKDLEALAAAGEGGVLLFNIANTIPYGRVAYNSDEHQEIIKHAAKVSERLGLSFGVHNCDGWSSSGGPWITPEQSMKMVVSSEIVTDGGNVSIKLPQPTIRENFYKDIAVLAYPALASEISDANIKPVITASDSNFDISTATDGWNGEPATLTKGTSENPWMLFDYGKLFSIRSLDIFAHGNRLEVALEISEDGKNFTLARKLKKPKDIGKQKSAFSEQFDPITARYFRLSFSKSVEIREATLRATRLYDNYLDNSGLSKYYSYSDDIETPNPEMMIPKNAIINLSSSFGKDGVLTTKLPKGKWTIMRFGYTSTGAINWPASKWGVGLECDKFSRPAFKKHFDAFVQRVINNSKPVAPNALQYIEVDSYEMGGQTWTEGFAETFKKEKGYDIIPFLPLFAGKYIDSPDLIANVTWDLKKLYADLMGKNYWDYFSELCHENGLISYAEPYGNGPINGLDVCEKMDIPMGEFWTTQPTSIIDTPISGAHIYGKSVVSAEAFTSRTIENWKFHPAMAKTKGDEMWAKGINEFMFHRYTHQPNTHVKPGLTMARYGSHVDRTQTWWMNAGKAWFSYLSRGQHLLRQGHHAADVLVFVGDEPNNGDVYRRGKKSPIPLGINYDCTNQDVLINRITIKDKKLVLPEGNPYLVLMLEKTKVITLSSLRRIKEIADAGVPVAGEKPGKLAGHIVSEKEQGEFTALVNHIWSLPNCSETYDFSEFQRDFEVVGAEEKMFMHRRTTEEDIYFFSNPDSIAKLYQCNFRITNKIPELWNPVTGEITKIARFKSEGVTTVAWIKLAALESTFVVFRESTKGVKSIEEANDENEYSLDSVNRIVCVASKAGEYTVKLSDGSNKMVSVKANEISEPIDISKSWNVDFLEAHDYEATIKFDSLSDWKDSSNEEIKYYAGTAIYRKSFNLPNKLGKTERAVLDLGKVCIAAEVIVNGNNAGVLWIAPFTLDITKYLHKGENSIEVKITNQWTNKLIGDERYPRQDDGYKLSSYNPKEDSSMPEWFLNNEPMPEGPRTTFDSGMFYKKGDPLLPSGLLGPVSIVFKQEKTIK